jgi:NADPH:quinone reductase-like Zn-dependent oxidoreductase
MSMQACRVHQFGPPERIRVEEIPRPAPAAHELLVAVDAAGVGPWDGWIRAGKSVLDQPLPLTLGSDLSGRVVALGEGVQGFELGQLVFGVTNPRFTGAYAEYAIARASMVAPKPKLLTHVAAAALPVVSVTAHQMLFQHAHVREGQRVLIHGAGGSVGACAVQLAVAAGAYVIGTDVGRSAAYVRSLGAERVIDVTEERFEQVLEPVDVVIDTVGGEVLGRSLSTLRRGGTLISSASQPDAADVHRYEVDARFMLVDVTRAALEQVAELVDAGTLQVRLGPVLPLADARIAHEMLEGQRPREPGKIVLSVTG